MEPINRAEIFRVLCVRQKLRRDAGIRPLDLKAEYDHAVRIAEAARLRAIRAQYEPEVRNEILSHMRAIHGATWPRDLGSRYYLGALVNRTIFERYGV